MNRPGYPGPIEDWLPLVRWVLVRQPAHVRARLDDDDLFQAGVEGLLNAKRLFDPDRGASWKTYATIKVRWAMVIAAGLGDHGWEPIAGRLDGDGSPVRHDDRDVA